MRMRDVRGAGCIGLCGVALFVGCSSSDGTGPELRDGAVPDQLGADTAASADSPIDQQALDTPPSGEDGLTRLDGHYFTLTDGRQILQVDYCLPILPLSSGSQYCPATLDEARAALRSALDGGVLDAGPQMEGRPEISEPCVEPLVVYLPHGRGLGWVTTCYYESNSGQLLSIIAGSETPTGCEDSPIPNTAAFIAQVFGQLVTCTR